MSKLNQCGLKAQQPHSPGQRPGCWVYMLNSAPCKGNSLIIRLLPLQGVGLVWRIFTQGVLALASGKAERPWAMCFCPSGASYSWVLTHPLLMFVLNLSLEWVLCVLWKMTSALWKFLKKNFVTLRQTPCKYCTSECSEKVHSGEMRGVFLGLKRRK